MKRLPLMLCSASLLMFFSTASFGQGNGKFLPPNHINPKGLSQGGQMWWYGPQNLGQPATKTPLPPGVGLNVDAANPNEDLAPGQSETAIGASGNIVVSAWNDATNFFVTPSTDLRASGTGLAISRNGGSSFHDLVGLPNNNPNLKWEGDPSVVMVDNGHFFIVSSIYAQSFPIDCTIAPAEGGIAVSVGVVTPTGVEFSNPILAASSGDPCSFFGQNSFLDKDFMTYDPVTRTVALSYTRFSFFGFGTGQIEVVTAQIPFSPPFLTSADFSAPIVVWPEEFNLENEGAYPALAYNASKGADDIFVAWERNWGTNQFNGNPLVYIYLSQIEAGTNQIIGTPGNPVVVTLNQANSDAFGGVKSLDVVPIPGYNRGTSNDFPRVTWNSVKERLVVAWNDASHHPLGDIFLRAYPRGLNGPGPIHKVNDDNDGAMHMFPAVCSRSDGATVTSWYDRRDFPADSANTDLFAEVRADIHTNGADFKVTTTYTDWTNTSSIIIPNFGDYTDNACDGLTTYFNWSDGRTGVPQPFVAHN